VLQTNRLPWTFWAHLWLMICARTVVAERRVSVRGRLHPGERLSIEAELRRSASDTNVTMLSGFFGLRSVNQRPLYELRWNNQWQNLPSHSQENSGRQNQQSHLQRAATYVYKKHRFYVHYRIRGNNSVKIISYCCFYIVLFPITHCLLVWAIRPPLSTIRTGFEVNIAQTLLPVFTHDMTGSGDILTPPKRLFCSRVPFRSSMVHGRRHGGAGWASAHPVKNQGGHGPPWKF